MNTLFRSTRGRIFPAAAALCAVLGTLSPANAQSTAAAPANAVSSSMGDLRVQRLATLTLPWGLEFLPDGRLLITEKPGNLRIWADGTLSEPVRGVPKVAYIDSPSEQGGLMDVAIDPEFARNGFIYLSFSEAAEQQAPQMGETDDYRLTPVDKNDTVIRGAAVARARLEGNELRDVKVIWRQVPKTLGRGHFGGRLAFAGDRTLYITSGDRKRFEPAQDLASNLGKVVRINTDGSIPRDNPFFGRDDARADIWSYGHRNPLSCAFDPTTGRLWIVEMGPLRGDELNLIKRGANYGWPLVSDGDHYGRPGVPSTLTSIPGHGTSDEFEASLRSWTPVISPSGAAFYNGQMFRQWRGSLFVGGLSSKSLIRLVLTERQVAIEERIDLGMRIRDVIEAPDGALLVIEDDREGGLYRLTPQSGSSSAQR